MTRFSIRHVVFAALAAVALTACPGAQTKPTSGGEERPGAAKPGAAAPTRPEDLVTGRSLRLFEDAVKSYQDQKQLHVFDWPLLERKFKAVTEADDRFGEAWFNLGVIYEHQRRPDDARRAYRRALDKKPSLKQAAENLAVMAENEGKPAEAAEIYKDILRKSPDDGAARARIASLYRESGDHDRAMKFAREALMREPQNLTAYKVMMRIYLERNNLNMAKLVALRATRLAQDPELYFTMGLIALKENDEQGAVLQFRQALKERDDFLAARVALADIAVRHRDWANAGEQYRKIVQYDPKNVPARINLGLAYKGLGQVDKAMAEYDAAMKADSRFPEPFFFMGVIFQKSKDAPDKALQYYKKFIEVSGGAVAADHPVYENIKECEQYLRAMQEAKAEEERLKAEKAAAEEKAKREAEEKKRLEDQQKKEEADKARAEDEAKRQQEREKRQREAREAVDALHAPDAKPAKQQTPRTDEPKPAKHKQEPAPESMPDPRPEARKDAKKDAKKDVPASGSDEPADRF